MVVQHVLIAAGGTGGHVYPALAVADEMQSRGVRITWVGTHAGLESRVVPAAGYDFMTINIRGLRGKGIMNLLVVPLKLLYAIWQVVKIFRSVKPDAVLGLGGFVTGPCGLAAVLLRKPLYLHEQNAVPGLTNKVLSGVARCVMQAFPHSFKNSKHIVTTGNPVRKDIVMLPAPQQRMAQHQGALRVLVVGGSLGAKALNDTVPPVVAALTPHCPLDVWHQSGKGKLEQTRMQYETQNMNAKVTEFIDDMAAAYDWADLVICRAGALTVSELASAGVASVLVPYPHAVDDHQTANAAYLTRAGAALLIAQHELEHTLKPVLSELCQAGRDRLLQMAEAARKLAMPEASKKVADICLEVAHG